MGGATNALSTERSARTSSKANRLGDFITAKADLMKVLSQKKAR